MDADALCKAYLTALESGCAEDVAALFAPGGTVRSPLYGEMPALGFYQRLFADTARSQTTLLRVLTGSAPDNAVALHFQYRWTLADDAVVEFEVVDIIERAEDGAIETLTILYDTAPLREAHGKAAGRQAP